MKSLDLQSLMKKNYQRQYWLKKAKAYGIITIGREDEAAREAEARYRKGYRERKRAHI